MTRFLWQGQDLENLLNLSIDELVVEYPNLTLEEESKSILRSIEA